jgi:hypothetical protein
MQALGLPGAPVLAADGTLVGVVDAHALESTSQPLAEQAAEVETIAADDTLDVALATLADSRRSWVPVTSDSALVGILSIRDVLRTYQAALAANVRQIRAVQPGGSLIDAEIRPGSALDGRRVADANWPRDTLLVRIGRGDRVIVPRGEVALAAGDHVTVFATPASRNALEELLRAEAVTVVGPG